MIESFQVEDTSERYRLLVESIYDYAIIMLDLQGRVVSWNAGAERINGYSADEIIGSHFSCFYLPEDVASRLPERDLSNAVAQGHIHSEGWRQRKDGSRFWAEVEITATRDELGQHRGFAKVTRDLTERMRAEERLRESEELFRLLVENVKEYAIFMLDPSGRVTTWNAGAQKIKQYTAKDIVGRHFECFYTPEDRANGKPARLLARAAEEGDVRDQGVRVRKDGSIFHAEVVITAMRNRAGVLRGFSKVTRDITDQIRNREMEAAKIAAEQSNKAKDDFLAVLSHELRTPLTPVLAATSYLMESAAKLPPELRDEVGTIRRNVQMEARLIDDLLDLTRISKGKVELHPEAVDAHAAVHDVVRICREDILAKKQQLELRLDAQRRWLHGDPIRIRQIFWNLVNNAVKFTPDGGRITIRTSDAGQEQFQLDVEDNGHGIEPEHMERIFGAFQQGERHVTRRFGGLGLGLAISKNLVILHRGEIGVTSEGVGKGACFFVRLAGTAAPPSLRATGAPGPRSAAETLRILVVEDHDDTRRILSRLLLKRGHQVLAAETVEQAKNLLHQNRFDVLISDIGLPDASGFDMVKQAKQHQPLKAIALSGFGMEEDVNRSLAAGFDYHMTKPVDFQNLDAILDEIRR